MKKLILALFILFGGLVFTNSTYAQTDRAIREVYNQDYERNNRGWERSRHYVVRRYRYVRIGNQTYLEVWGYIYNRNGRLTNRVLIMRDRVYVYDRYSDWELRRRGIRLNIFFGY